MDIIQLLNTGMLLIGLPLILKAFLDIDKKLQILDSLEREIRLEIRPALQELNRRMFEVEKRLALLENKVNLMWEWFSHHVITSNQTTIASQQ
jgi:hypothetical protein